MNCAMREILLEASFPQNNFWPGADRTFSPRLLLPYRLIFLVSGAIREIIELYSLLEYSSMDYPVIYWCFTCITVK